MRLRVLASACLLVGTLMGCSVETPPDPARKTLASEGSTGQPNLDPTESIGEPVVPSSEPERTTRAREVYLRGVRLLAGTPQIDQAITCFQQALEIDPQFFRAHFKLGICYYMKGQYPLEIVEYKKCLAINQGYVPGWLNLGHAYLARDELELARDSYQRVLELDPNHATALYNKALIEFDLHNLQESEDLFRRFLRVDGEGEMGERARRYLDELQQRRQEGN